MSLKLKLFGQLQVLEREKVITPALRPRAQRLLGYLLLHRQTPLTRKRIAFSLWPDRAEKRALGSLRRALSELRTSLPRSTPVPWIDETSSGLRWNIDASYWLDIEAFDSLTRQATIPSLHEAVALYTGELLAGWDEEWLLADRERLRQLQLTSLRQLVAHHRAVGEVNIALDLTRRALDLEPLAEATYRDLIALHYEAGDRAAALAEYERLRTLLRDELGVEPMAETEALKQAIVQGEPLPAADDPAITATPPPVTDLPKLFGRQAELAELRSLWQASVSGQSRSAIVSGEAGIGKSHLVRSLASHAIQQGGLVLTGHCFEFEQALPFQAIVEMLRAATTLLRHADLDPAHRAVLARLAPDVLGATGSPVAESGRSLSQLRSQLFEALFHAFLTLARRQPLLLIFEDAHWAAESTLDWLTYIAPRLGANRLLVIITYRTHEVDARHALVRLERRLAHKGFVLSLSLRPLSRQSNRELVAHLSGLDEQRVAKLADQLFTETGGNPFFLHELVRGLIETGQIKIREGRWAGALVEAAPGTKILLPDSVRDTIKARVARLSEMSRMFIRTAAVAGRVFQYSIVRHAGGWSEERALQALEDLLARGFLHQGDSEESFAFSHHLVQEAIYTGLTPPRRIYLHRQLAKAIQALRPDDVESLVHHFIAAGEQDRAIEYALQAAQRADAMHAYEEAAQYRLIALEQMKGQAEPEARLALLEELADDYRLLRQGARAVSTYQDALNLWQSSKQADRTVAVRLYRKILEAVADMLGNADFQEFESVSQVSAALRTKLDDLVATMESELSQIEDGLRHLEMMRLFKALAVDALIPLSPADRSEAINYAQKAVAIAEKLNRPVELATALTTLARVYGANGLLRERVDAALRALAICRDQNFENLRDRIHILNEAGCALTHAGEYKQAIPYLLEAERLAGQIRAVDEETRALLLLHLCWFRLDRWDDMFKAAERRRTLEQHYSLERLGSSCFAIALSAAVHTLRGDPERGERLREESYAIMASIGGPHESWRRGHYY